MKDIPISQFKSTCLAVIEEVNRTGERVRITKFGHPMAELVPTRADRHFVGAFAGKGRILGDLIAPASDASDWEALKD